MKYIKKEFIYGFMVGLTILILTLIVLEIPKIEHDIKHSVQNNMLHTVSSIVDNVETEFTELLDNNPDKTLIEILEKSPKTRDEIEHHLSLIISEDIKFCYVLYRDGKGKFRFMLDGAKHDKADFKRKFDVEDSAWERAYTTRQPQTIKQKEMFGLWLTYLHPVVRNNQVEGIIAIDYSLEGFYRISKIIQPLQDYIWIFIGMMILGIIVSVSQYVLYQISKRQIYIDPLTNLYNRNYFNEIMSKLDFQKYAIAIIDLDKFKIINDTYGHDLGDKVLQMTADTIKKSIREYDHLVRYGGEEFILYISMRDSTHQNILEITERIRRNVEVLIIKTGLISLNPTISIGLNTYTSHFTNEHDAIDVADKMLYEAKRTGRNRVTMYFPSKSVETKSVPGLNVHHVKEAIEEKRIFCEYQPIVELTNKQIVGYEALIRIRSSDGATIYPGMFLPNIMHSNIYRELTNELLSIVFAKVYETKCCISLNLNITDVLDDEIFKNVLEHLNAANDNARYLTFELLEEEQISNLELLKERIEMIRSFNARISLDDFGSGYSNFSHIFALDVDIIKIDGSLIKDIDKSDVSRRLIESIVAFANASNKRVVAEYIHSETVLSIVQELTINYGQGFYLGKPNETLVCVSCNV